MIGRMSAGWTSKILRGWLCLEDIARDLSGHEENDNDDDGDWDGCGCGCGCGCSSCCEMDTFEQQQQHDMSTSTSNAIPACIDDELVSDTTSQQSDGMVLLDPPASSSSSSEQLSVGVYPRHNQHQRQGSGPNGNVFASPATSPFPTTSTGSTHRYEPMIGPRPTSKQQEQQQRLLLARTNRSRSQQRRRRRRYRYVPESWMARCILKSILVILGSALIASYAVVHVHIIQEGDVFYTAWFYEWFLIPVLLSFVWSAPLHRALGFDYYNYNNKIKINNSTATTTATTTIHNQNDNDDIIIIEGACCSCLHYRLQLLENDVTTQRLIMVVVLCYILYIVGDAAFFIPLSPNQPAIITYPMYLTALIFNIGFIYQGFFLSILTMRALVVRLNVLQESVNQVLMQHTAFYTTTITNTDTDPVVTREQILEWTQAYQCLRQDMQSLSENFGLRMVLGVTMFVVEVTNTILKVWEAVGSTLTKGQTCLLLLTYTSSAAMLIMVTFQTAYTSTTCEENIGPRLAMLSLRTNNSNNNSYSNSNHQYDVKAELNVLAQTCMQAPIRLRVGNFHFTAEYANALAAWFFGLLLVVFGMKLPNY